MLFNNPIYYIPRDNFVCPICGGDIFNIQFGYYIKNCTTDEQQVYKKRSRYVCPNCKAILDQQVKIDKDGRPYLADLDELQRDLEAIKRNISEYNGFMKKINLL